MRLGSGWLSDRSGRRKPFLFFGYGISAVTKAALAVALSWPMVLALRFGDRVGKGLRTVFLLAAIPAALVVLVILLGVREAPLAQGPAKAADRGSWRDLDGRFRLFLLAMLVFALGNSTDAFILLLLQHAGMSAAGIAVVWSLFHVVKMVSTYIGGRLSDRLGRRPMVLAGWATYAAAYLAFALVSSPAAVLATFFCYGLYYGLTEPVERAWVVELAPANLRGTALGLYHGIVGLGALPASVLFGLVWKAFGAPVAFGLGAALAGVAALVLLGVRSQPPAAATPAAQ
jgi:MFS family permease